MAESVRCVGALLPNAAATVACTTVAFLLTRGHIFHDTWHSLPGVAARHPRTLHGQNQQDRVDLARRRVRPLGRCHRPRPESFSSIRVVGLRGDSMLRYAARPGDFPTRGPSPAVARLVQDLPYGREVFAGRA